MDVILSISCLHVILSISCLHLTHNFFSLFIFLMFILFCFIHEKGLGSLRFDQVIVIKIVGLMLKFLVGDK